MPNDRKGFLATKENKNTITRTKTHRDVPDHVGDPVGVPRHAGDEEDSPLVPGSLAHHVAGGARADHRERHQDQEADSEVRHVLLPVSVRRKNLKTFYKYRSFAILLTWLTIYIS